MADQSVRIVNDDVAATAYRMAENLWVQQYEGPPKVSDAGFLCLVQTCVVTLRSHTDHAEIRKHIAAIIQKTA